MKKKSIFFVAALSIISSAAVFASDDASVDKHEGAKAKKATGTEATYTKEVSLETLQKQLNALQHQVAEMKKQHAVMHKKHKGIAEERAEVQSAGVDGSLWSKIYAYGPAVVTTPIIGTSDYTGWDLYTNFGTANEDMQFMQRRQQVYSYDAQRGITPPERPVLALSGSLEMQAWTEHDNDGGNSNDINLSTVAIEAVANVNEWITGMVKLKYLDLSPSEHDVRANKGDVLVDRAYIVIGNLDKFPIFGSIGQMRVPFDMDANFLTTDPSTKNLGKMVERPVVLGYSAEGFYGKLYAFKGDVYDGKDNNVINNWGGMLGYKGMLGNLEKVTVDIGAGAIKNLADSLGLQGTGNSAEGEFQGFGRDNKHIHSTVNAVSAHAIAHYSNIVDFVADYVGAVQSFDKQDMSFGGNSAKPQALDLEAQYNFTVLGKPSSVGVGFDRTWEALAANLPKYSYFVFAGTSLFKRTWQGIEWRHDVNYNSSDSATGLNLPVTVNWKHSDTITGSFKIFF